MANQLYFGDNLEVLRDSIKPESVDLIYLDPPFNSNATYNVLFGPKGNKSDAQIAAFEDTWHWGKQAEKEFDQLATQPNTQVTEVMRALRGFLGENDMMAYLTMMANRLLELHRVLKPTGSLYLHCDPTASHYLKIVLDAVFGAEHFLNEIVWKRTHAHGLVSRYGPIHDIIFFYSKSPDYVWTSPKAAHAADYVEKHFKLADPDGRRFSPITLTGSGVRNGESGQPWRGINPTKVHRHWAVPGNIIQRHGLGGKTVQEKLDALDAAGLVFWPKGGKGVPRLKWYADELTGQAIADVWTDIPPLSANAAERLGYPTQKPQVLLERIINASSNPGDVVLDPFCGCGTAVHAAQKLGRQWIGIDITHLAISLIEKRLRDAFRGITFEVHGTPKDMGGATDLATRDKFEFQCWVCSLVNAHPYRGGRKGADGGVDGLIYFQDDKGAPKKVIVSVKGGENVGVTMVKDLIATVARQGAEMGIFVTLSEPTRPMLTEAVSAGFYTSPANGAKFQKVQVLTVEDLLSGKARAAYPSLDAGAATFQKAALEHGEDTQHDMFHAAPAKKSKGPGKVPRTARVAPARGR